MPPTSNKASQPIAGTACFRINDRHVAAEIIDGEAIIVSLLTGSYYSLVGSGAEIWAGITKQHPVGRIVSDLTRRYSADPEVIAASALELIELLTAEGLIVEAQDAPPPDPDPADGTRIVPAHFVAPLLEKFDDMADIIVLDPVHDAGSAGWPQLKDQPADR